MPSQIDKLAAHQSHLLDAFIQLRERFAMLRPMLFDQALPVSQGSGAQARGFLILRQSLFLSCAQDIAKLCLDSDKRTPSIKNLLEALADDSVRTRLREQFADWKIPDAEDEKDPELKEALRRIELREQAEEKDRFDKILEEARQRWIQLEADPALQGFRTIRDRISAHTEVHLVGDKYQFVDIGALGIKWSDMGRLIDAMQHLTEATGLLIRNAGFAWDMLDSQLSKASQAFWSPSAA